MQRGTIDLNSASSTENDQTYYFNISFPSNCLNLSCTRKKASFNSTHADAGVLISSTTSNSFTVSLQGFANSDDARGFTWFAVGF